MGYCGFRTKLNKKLWTIAVIFSVLCVAFVIAAAVSLATFNNKLGDRDPENLSDNELEEVQTPAILWWVFLALAILASLAGTIPCYVMCCCASPPDRATAKGSTAAPMAQVVGNQQPHAGYNAGTYNGGYQGHAGV